MYPYKAFLTLGTLAMTLGVSSAAKGSSDIALSFELSPSPQAEAEAAAIAEAEAAPATPAPPVETLVNAEAPLPIPPGAENPPMAGDNRRPAGVYGGLDAIAIGAAPSVQALLPPPPPIPDYVQPAPVVVAPPLPNEAEAANPAEQLSDQEIQDQVEFMLGFQEKTFAEEEAPAAPAPENASQALEVATFTDSWDNLAPLFAGGTDSLVAWAVGSAEGTRTAHGHKNPAYYGHVDPGNGVWNLGTFSYQHGAATPEEADAKQLQRLQNQTELLRQKALAKGLQLSQEELLNGIDLANQAPLAALDRGGYIDWLQKAHNLGMQGQEAIVWARTRSFIDPDTQRWNAPGLGNNVYAISHDQERRAKAIARALNAFTAQTQIAVAPAPLPSHLEAASVTPPVVEPSAPAPDTVAFGLQLPSPEQPADRNAAIATEPETEATASKATATIEEDEAVVALADPLTGVLLSPEPTLEMAPPATLSMTAQKSARPVFSRLNRTLTRLLQGHDPAPAKPPTADLEESAIAPGPAASPDSAAPLTSEAPGDTSIPAAATPTAAEPAAIVTFPAAPEAAPPPDMPAAPLETQLVPASAEAATPINPEQPQSPEPPPQPSTPTESSAPQADATAEAGASAATFEHPDATAVPGFTAADESAALEREPEGAAILEPAIAAAVPTALPPAPAESIPAKTSKAPAQTGDAFDLGQTLDSLNQFQQQLRQDLGA